MKKKFSYLLKEVKKSGEITCRHQPTLEEAEFFYKQGIGCEPTSWEQGGIVSDTSVYTVQGFRYFLLDK